MLNDVKSYQHRFAQAKLANTFDMSHNWFIDFTFGYQINL